MFKHFYKHLDLFDKVFIVLLLALGVLSGFVGAWDTVLYLSVILLFVFILKLKDITIKHQEDLIERLLELAEYATKALDGGKLVKKTTIEFSVEKVKKEEGKKPNEKKQRNENTPNSGGSRSSSSRKRTSKTANAKGTGTASVSNRKPKATKKNSKA